MSTNARIGIDVDGVLADFNESYVRKIKLVTGRDLFPGPYGTFPITCWEYPESFGYTTAEISAVWESIKADGYFWQGLRRYEDTTYSDLAALVAVHKAGHDIYFITARPGIQSKYQTERWLRDYLHHVSSTPFVPTVLITSLKGLACRTLALDYYIDDRIENCIDVSATSTTCFMMNRDWNAEHEAARAGIIRVQSVQDMLTVKGLVPRGATR